MLAWERLATYRGPARGLGGTIPCRTARAVASLLAAENYGLTAIMPFPAWRGAGDDRSFLPTL